MGKWEATLPNGATITITARSEEEAQARFAEAQRRFSEPTVGDRVVGSLNSAAEGAALGYGDEIRAATRTAGQEAGDLLGINEPQPMAERYAQNLGDERADMEIFRAKNPVVDPLLRTAGGAMTPMGATRSLGQAAVVGGTQGVVQGSGQAESWAEVPGEALKQGATGALLGPAMHAAFSKVPGMDALMKRRGALEDTATRFYDALEQGNPQMVGAKALRDSLKKTLDEGGYRPRLYPRVRAIMSELDDAIAAGGDAVPYRTFRGVQTLARRAGKSADEAEAGLGHLADDALIGFLDKQAKSTPAGQLMRASNDMYRRSKNFDRIVTALEKADRSAASSGTGGNTINRRRQVINNLINSKSEGRYFNEEERKLMDEFVRGGSFENFLRRAASYAPTRSALSGMGAGAAGMAAYNTGSPLLTAATGMAVAGGEAAKRSSERMSELGMHNLQRAMLGLPPTETMVTSGAGAAGRDALTRQGASQASGLLDMLLPDKKAEPTMWEKPR